MINDSRADLYEYLYDLFKNVFSENVYAVSVPQTLTNDDIKNGFLVITVGSITDSSEFSREAYGWVRCHVQAFIPPLTRGRLDYDKLGKMEIGINDVIRSASAVRDGSYHISEENILSSDVLETRNSDNMFHSFIKSFILNIN